MNDVSFCEISMNIQYVMRDCPLGGEYPYQ